MYWFHSRKHSCSFKGQLVATKHFIVSLERTSKITYCIHSKSCFISFYSIKVRNSNQNRVSGSHSTLAILSSLAGNDPGWSGRGGVLWCRLPSCVGHVCRPPINYCIWIVLVVHSSLIIMLLLKLLYLILSFLLYHEKWHPPPPAPPLARAPPNKSIPDHLWCNMQILNNPRENSSLLSVEILQESNKIWNICSKILEIIFNALSNETITYFCRHCPLSKVVWH
jgi:hypothetical protein